MDTDFQEVVLVKEEAPEEQSAGVDQQDPEHLHIKEEQEELWTSLEGEQFHLKEETDGARFPFTAVSIKSEDDEEKPLFSQLHQQQIENRDVPTCSSADQMTAETSGGAETSRNPDLNPHEQTFDSSEAEVGGDDEDVIPDSGLSDSGSETGDEDDYWNESDVQQVVLVKEEAPEEESTGVDQQDPNSLHIKEQQEELWTSLEGKQLHLKDTDGDGFPFTTVSIKSDDEEKPLFSQLHQHQIDDRDVPTSSSADLMAAETGGGAETHRNPDLNPHEQTSNSSETEVSGDDETENDDVNPDSELSDSGSETRDKDNWNESGVKSVNKSFSCPKCGKQFLHKGSLQKHVRVTNHSAIRSSDCLLNKKRVKVKQHVDPCRKVQKELTAFSFDDCGKILSHETNLNMHVGLHTGKEPFFSEQHFACELCGQRFSQKVYLNKHMSVHTGQKPFACELCGQRFTLKKSLNRHEGIHTGQKPFACELCGQRFTRKTSLNYHMRVHTEQKPFVCELCGQRFTHKQNLNRHISVHKGQKPFACELCVQRFTHKTNLNEHMKIHTGQKPFACELCGQRFTRKTGLNYHMSIHREQKPFACELCGQRFTHKQNLKRHTSVHTGHKPFFCEICGQRFTLKTNVNRHMSIHTGQKRFTCELCEQRFNQKAHLKRHMRTHREKQTLTTQDPE